MSTLNITMLNSLPLSEIMNQPAELVVEWLKGKPDAIGEAIAKMCYQAITRQGGRL